MRFTVVSANILGQSFINIPHLSFHLIKSRFYFSTNMRCLKIRSELPISRITFPCVINPQRKEAIPIFCYRTTKARSATLRQVYCTSRNAFLDWHRNAIGRRSGKSMSSMTSFVIPSGSAILTGCPSTPSVTASTDTGTLRVLLSALAGAFAAMRSECAQG